MSDPDEGVVHATVKFGDSIDPICRWKSGDTAYGAQRREGNRDYVTVESVETAWYRSWVRDPAIVADLDTVLAGAGSYGISLVGFSHEVSGKLAMGSFEIR